MEAHLVKGDYGVTVDQLSDMNSSKDVARLLELGNASGLAKLLHSDDAAGLDPNATGSASIESHRSYFGPNKFKAVPPKPIYKIMLDNMKDPILLLLVFAALISTVLGAAVPEQRAHGEYVEGIAIWIAVAAVNFIGSYNDYQKDQQFRKLNAQKDNIQVTVIRGKEKALISNHDVVVGDILCLDTGNKVVADGIVIESQGLTLDEASLTGESDPIKKFVYNPDNPKSDPWVRSGTQVSEGSGAILVIAVGPRSEWGKTMALVADAGDDWTPLQKKLGIVASAVGKIGSGVAISCFIAMLVKWCVENNGFPLDKVNEHGPIQFFMYSVTIIVVSIPEGLPLAVTIALAYAMKKMMKDQNFVRVLSACETMGGATTICSDKTGTLTENRMTVTEGWFAGVKLPQAPAVQDLRPELVEMLKVNVTMSSKAFLLESNGKVEFVGNRTECALLLLTKGWGTNISELQDEQKHNLVKLYGFSSARKMSSVVLRKDDGYRLYNKGAAEWVLARCTSMYTQDGTVVPMTQADKDGLIQVVSDMARRGLRCICLTFANLPATLEPSYFEEHEDVAHELTCMAIVGIKDPVRKEVPAAVETCKRAGITVRMVTGDNIDTARHIARECGILYDDSFLTMEGKDFRTRVDDPDFVENKLPLLRVLARSSPEDKLTLVSLLKKTGQVVAVTGDGTNDAPALKESDVGLAMGIAGTEVAKEAADIVILDDNFSSIVKSVLWGRSVFNSIRKFLQFQLTVNFVALVIAFVGAVSGGIEPLTVLQLLWVNLIMDTMGALALATEPPHPKLLEDKPYDRSEALITKTMMKHILLQGAYQLFWLHICLYVLPIMFDRYKISSKKDVFFERCESSLDKKFDWPSNTTDYLCQVMQWCGFPYNKENRNAPKCPLWEDFNFTTVPTDLPTALCRNATGSCTLLRQYKDAKEEMDDRASLQKYKDYEAPLSVLFNAFIMMQVFNEICARRLKDEFTILNGVATSPTFVGVIVVTLAFQVIIMQTPIGTFFKVKPLDWKEWLACIAIGLGMIPMSLTTRAVSRLFKKFKGPEPEPDASQPISTKKGEIVPIDDDGNPVSSAGTIKSVSAVLPGSRPSSGRVNVSQVDTQAADAV